MRRVGRGGFAYGNTRLRARRGELLRDEDYERLLGADVDGLLQAVGEVYRSPVAPAAKEPGGLRRLHQVVRARLGRSLEDMRSFYAGPARGLVDALLSRFDVQNVVSILRARSQPGTTSDDALASLAPVGWLTESLARDVLRAQELAGAVDLLAQSAPSPALARVLRAAFSEYERTSHLAQLEREVVSDHAARVAAALDSAGSAGATLRAFVQRETDDHNVLVALRLRDAVASGAEGTPVPSETLLPGGSMPVAVVSSVVHTADAAAVAETLSRAGGRRRRAALERWQQTGDLTELQRRLERDTIAGASVLFVTGDPLGIDIPLAFTCAQRVEAANLRLLGEAADQRIPPDAVRRELVWQEARR